MKRTERTYSKTQKASALAVLDSNEGKALTTSNETGIPRTTIINWRDGLGVDEEVQEIRQEKKEELSEIFERVARKYLKQAESPEVVSATKGRDSVISAATATDKMQLLRGKATNITGSTIEIEQAKQLLEHQLKLNENSPLQLTKYDIYVNIIQRFFSNVSMEALEIEAPENQGVKGNEGEEPAPER